MFDGVVVGIGGYEAGRDAIALAKVLLAGDGAVTLVYVDVLLSRPAPDADTRPDDEARRFGLERLGRLRDEGQIAAEISRIESPSVRRGLYEFAAGQGADLLVIGARRNDPVAHMFLGDEAREVLEDPPCAVAVAPIGYAERVGDFATIGVAYDGSAGSDEAVATGRKLAAGCHATLSVFEAVAPPVYACDVYDVEGQIEEEVAQARDQIAALGGVEADAVAADHTVEALRRYEATVDLLIVGPHKYTPLDRLREQTTPQRLADSASRPLLVLPDAPASARSRELRDDRSLDQRRRSVHDVPRPPTVPRRPT